MVSAAETGTMRKSRARIGTRDICVYLHRYAGLLLAGFLILTGSTGSIIAFQRELDTWLNPELYRARASGPLLSPGDLAARVERADPRLTVTYLPFRPEPGRTIVASIRPKTDPATGKPYDLDADQVFIDPASGAILGLRRFGACCFARPQLIPFLYDLHAELTVGRIGKLILGSVAILWALDCFIGLYLTLPRAGPFLAKWKPSWLIKRGAGSYRLTFDLHRAAGLWLWLVLLSIAVSGVYLTLDQQVFRPTVSLFSKLTPMPAERAQLRLQQGLHDTSKPRIGFDAAVAIAAVEAKRHGWDLPPTSVYDAKPFGAYGVYFFHAPNDRGLGLGTPIIYLDDRSGEIISVILPGQGTAGDIFIQAQFPLHSGQVAGLPGRIFISTTGLVVTMLSVTGIIIWNKKRRARSAQRRRAR